MSNVLENPDTLKEFDEVYEVVKTVDVVRGMRRYRIEVLKSLRHDIHFQILSWRHEDVNVQPSYPRSGGEFEKKPEDISILVSGGLPWVHMPTVELALRQALNFLSGRE